MGALLDELEKKLDGWKDKIKKTAKDALECCFEE